MDEVAVKQFMQIAHLENELQQQKGMLWVLGEIMKVANNIDSFKQLMELMTDMLMGVTGVNTCYLWVYDKEDVRVYLRSTESNNKFYELDKEAMHECLKEIRETKLYGEEEICFPLVRGGELPGARLLVPLIDFNDNSIIGGLILEQQQKDFFTSSSTIFFETLGVFIAANAKNSRLFEMVSEESERDPLTGVYNRRQLKKMIGEMIKESGFISLAIIDIDNFKAVNDFLGHIKGDEVLHTIATYANSFFGDMGGKVVRYGGDEFVFLMPTPIKKGLEYFTKFQELIVNLPGISQLTIPVAITMGVCCYPEMTRDMENLIEAADQALIRGKDQGKNRVMLATKEECDCKCKR